MEILDDSRDPMTAQARTAQATRVHQLVRDHGAVGAAFLYDHNHRGACAEVLAARHGSENGRGPSGHQTGAETGRVDPAQGTAMATIKPVNRISQLGDDELRRMVGPDPVRPGPSRYRIYLEDWHLPSWPIIGHLKHVTHDAAPEEWDADTLGHVAKEWSISLDAMAAAVL
jgi:hypothetical protein